MPMRVPAVWFVDDDEDDRLFIRSAFEESSPSVSVLTLNNGEQLLAELSSTTGKPQLILLDLNMPGLNGFDTLSQVRAEPAYEHVPIVLLTTSTSEKDRERGLALGASDFITKPSGYLQLASLAQTLTQQWSLVG